MLHGTVNNSIIVVVAAAISICLLYSLTEMGRVLKLLIPWRIRQSGVLS
jgi:hypothetical protein